MALGTRNHSRQVRTHKCCGGTSSRTKRGWRGLNRSRFILEEIGQDEWQQTRGELLDRLEAAKEALVVVESRASRRPGNREELEEWWAAATIEERRTAVRYLFDFVVIHPAKGRGSKFDTSRVQFPPWSFHPLKIVNSNSATPSLADPMASDNSPWSWEGLPHSVAAPSPS